MSEPPPQDEHDPRLLDYRARNDDRRSRRNVKEVVCGFFAWVLAAVLGVFSGTAGNTDFTIFACTVLLIGLFVTGTYLRAKHDWKGFLPGVLLGFGLTCLLPVGLAAVICGLSR